MNTVTDDLFASHAFRASDCLAREDQLVGLLKTSLQDRGYQAHPEDSGVYTKGSKRVFLGIVDDVTQGKSMDFYNDLQSTDLIITDNHFLRPVEADVVTLPDSWFGIYAHVNEHQSLLPDRAFTMPVNRIDVNRVAVLLRMDMYGHIDQGYVNFNCFEPGQDTGIDQRLANWDNKCTLVREQYGNKYDTEISALSARMPLKNHDLGFDQSILRGGLHMVIETYSSDHAISFSEKTFRALCLPRPWTLLASPWAVSRLRQLGFDVMSDIIEHHRYDGLRMVDSKLAQFVAVSREYWGEWSDTQNIPAYQQWYQDKILPRALEAASNNQKILQEMRGRWWVDMVAFLAKLNDRLE
jgi:hypothetical protein